jgi:hypothetical protein
MSEVTGSVPDKDSNLGLGQGPVCCCSEHRDKLPVCRKRGGSCRLEGRVLRCKNGGRAPGSKLVTRVEPQLQGCAVVVQTYRTSVEYRNCGVVFQYYYLAKRDAVRSGRRVPTFQGKHAS